jgi:HlyD family secretion protein
MPAMTSFLRRHARWLIGIAVAIGLIAALRATVFKPKPLDVEVAAADIGPVEDAVANSQAGTVRARRRSRLGVERAGRVVAIPHREGAVVKRGAVLLELDASSARHQLDLARREQEALRAALLSAQAAARLARQEFTRIETLSAQNVVSAEQLDQARSRRDAADAELQAAEARLARAASAVRMANDELAHLKVVAPFDGVISTRLVEVGESVIPGQPVLELVSLERLYVSAPIDELDIGRLKVGLPARVTLDPYPGVTWNGVLSLVSAVVNDVREQNRTLDVEVEMAPDPTRPTPKPGTSADIQIVLDRRDSVLRVPTFAIAENRRVMVIENGRATTREVKTGLKNWEWTEVREGLKPGERVITNLDRPGLKAGVAVAPKERAERPG